MRKAFLSLLAIPIGAGAAAALERTDLIFYAGFEGSLKPEVSAGPVEIRLNPPGPAGVEFVAGRRGRGVRLKPTQGVVFTGRCLFAAREGTLACWVQPLGWKKGDGLNHYVVTAGSPAGSFMLYKFYPGNTWVYLTGSGRTTVVGGYWDEWEDGQWTFLAFTFKPGEQVWYINGQAQGRATERLIEPDFSQGAHIHLHAASQVVDEMMVFGRALAGPEVLAVYRANRPAGP